MGVLGRTSRFGTRALAGAAAALSAGLVVAVAQAPAPPTRSARRRSSSGSSRPRTPASAPCSSAPARTTSSASSRSGRPKSGRAAAAPVAALPRPALRLPARRRGVAGAGRVRRLSARSSAAWRPWEAMNPQIDDAMVRQLNAFAAASPLAAGDGSHRAMDLTINTGDAADSQQLNETEWVRTLMEGGTLEPGQRDRPGDLGRPVLRRRRAADRRRRDARQLHRRPGLRRLLEGARAAVLRPRRAGRRVRRLAAVPGPAGSRPAAVRGGRARRPLLHHLRQPRRARAGQRRGQRRLRGGRDRLREADVAGGHRPGHASPARSARSIPANLQSLLLDRPDQRRARPARPEAPVRLASSSTRRSSRPAPRPTATASASSTRPRSTASERRRRLLLVEPAARDPDHLPRHRLRGRRDRSLGRRQHRRPAVPVAARASSKTATKRGRAGHPLQPPRDPEPDRRRPRRGRRRRAPAADPHGHDVEPGLRPRPARLGADPPRRRPRAAAARVPARDRLDRRPLARQQRRGRTPNPSGTGGFWSIRVAAEADWPQQAACSSSSTTRDGTLSIFGTIVDHASARPRRRPGPAAAFSTDELASVGRTLAYNDTQTGARACGAGSVRRGRGEGPQRRAAGRRPAARLGGGGGRLAGRCANALVGTGEARPAARHRGGDRIRGRGGNDRLSGKAATTACRAAAATTGSTAARARTSSRAAAAATGSRPATASATRSAADPGRDRVKADRKDKISKSCERVKRRPLLGVARQVRYEADRRTSSEPSGLARPSSTASAMPRSWIARPVESNERDLLVAAARPAPRPSRTSPISVTSSRSTTPAATAPDELAALRRLLPLVAEEAAARERLELDLGLAVGVGAEHRQVLARRAGRRRRSPVARAGVTVTTTSCAGGLARGRRRSSRARRRAPRPPRDAGRRRRRARSRPRPGSAPPRRR